MLGTMAPSAPTGRARAIQLIQEGPLPISLGSPHPAVAIVEQEGKFRIRELVIDRAAAEAAASNAGRARSPSWMPEHYYALGAATGKIFAEAASRAELVELMNTMSWPENW
jgi:hypothetical protein